MAPKKSVGGDLGELLSLDLNSLTIDEIDIIEEVTDAPLDELRKPGRRRGPMLRAMAVVLKRRTDPGFSIEDAGQLRLEFKGGKAKPDPTGPSA
ncbi:hypothetical protein OG914_06705 [Streptomyces sp. NBC_00291]|uniref:hypothetical protein n=1 Tax=Streptomyces sp. NBC_00291 TaxID=2975704 RepID=UPI002257DAE3|nr:hypothetical protein [Streptomyces sp. NBC_00291]MCX5153700.1 hypothetical protein [Streptomyces sp. NBC_00291]